MTGDGAEDSCVGAHGAELFAGEGGVWVFDPSQLPDVGGPENAAARIVGEYYCDLLGWRLAGGADFNEDGFDDWAFSAPWTPNPTKGAGLVFVFMGEARQP